MRREGGKVSNKGAVTIFITLILVVMLTLLTAVIYAVKAKCARAKAAAALSGAMSSIKADYNSYIFENYHLLLFDKTYYGKGDGETERLIIEYLENNLGDGFEVRDVVMSAVNTLLADDCAALGNQISDYMKYSLVETVADKLIDKVKGIEDADEPVGEDELNKIDEETAGGLAKTDGMGEDYEDVKKAAEEYIKEHPEAAEKYNDKEDPRMMTNTVSGLYLAALICPEDVSFSENRVDLLDVPSGKKLLATYFPDLEIDTSFRSYGSLSGSLTDMNGWGDSLKNYAAIIAYDSEVFKCLRDQRERETYLNMEREYLICGEAGDPENYVGTIKKLIKLRLGFNFAYIITDASKMARVSALAATLTWWAPYLQPLVKYLLAGCWAYVESCADTRFLVEGKKVPLVKKEEDWVTDLYGVKELLSVEKEDDDRGLDYEEYLMILMALQGDKLYYRTADLIELNTRQFYPDFRMENAAVEFAVDAVIEYGDTEIKLYREDGY
ncbi:MAG: hypothetical protein IJ703_02220 [Eubacterium sp.]|nr:hypothetical protein [Eubacterium sp.]